MMEKKPRKANNADNLKGKGFESRSTKEVREIASKGGKNSVEARRKKKLLKDCFDVLLEKDYKRKDGYTASGAETLALTVFEKAQRGDLKAFELVRDTAGQKPVDKVMLAEVDQKTIDEVESMVLGDSDDNKETGN